MLCLPIRFSCGFKVVDFSCLESCSKALQVLTDQESSLSSLVSVFFLVYVFVFWAYFRVKSKPQFVIRHLKSLLQVTLSKCCHCDLWNNQCLLICVTHVHSNISISVKLGVVNSQFYRFLGLCSCKEFFVSQVVGLIVLLKNKGDPQNL